MASAAAYAYCSCGGIVGSSTTSISISKRTVSPLYHHQRNPLRRPRAVRTTRVSYISCVLGGNVPSSANNDNDNDSSGKSDESGESSDLEEEGGEEDTSKEVLEVFRSGISDKEGDAESVGMGSSKGSRGVQVELPLFPLQVVLNPGCVIPLYIFELRYRLLFNRIHEGQEARFGVVMFDKESESLARIGCSAELVRFEPLPDGRIMTRNVGKERFRIVKILDEEPYIRALVEYISDDIPSEECAKLERDVWAVLQDVLSLSNKLYDKEFDMTSEIQKSAPPPPPDNTTSGMNNKMDPARMQEFSFAVNQILDMPLRDQQLLLQMKDTGKRLRRQNRMLRTARNYLAAQVTIKNAGLKGW